MIIVITTRDTNPCTQRDEIIVSHGVDVLTDKTVVLPCVTPAQIGAVFRADIGEYVLPDP